MRGTTAPQRWARCRCGDRTRTAVRLSSRVNDARSAQQIGALIILPIAGLLVVQLTGNFTLTAPIIAFIALALTGVNAALTLIGIALFDRESILTRWK